MAQPIYDGPLSQYFTDVGEAVPGSFREGQESLNGVVEWQWILDTVLDILRALTLKWRRKTRRKRESFTEKFKYLVISSGLLETTLHAHGPSSPLLPDTTVASHDSSATVDSIDDDDDTENDNDPPPNWLTPALLVLLYSILYALRATTLALLVLIFTLAYVLYPSTLPLIADTLLDSRPCESGSESASEDNETAHETLSSLQNLISSNTQFESTLNRALSLMPSSPTEDASPSLEPVIPNSSKFTSPKPRSRRGSISKSHNSARESIASPPLRANAARDELRQTLILTTQNLASIRPLLEGLGESSELRMLSGMYGPETSEDVVTSVEEKREAVQEMQRHQKDRSQEAAVNAPPKGQLRPLSLSASASRASTLSGTSPTLPVIASASSTSTQNKRSTWSPARGSPYLASSAPSQGFNTSTQRQTFPFNSVSRRERPMSLSPSLSDQAGEAAHQDTDDWNSLSFGAEKKRKRSSVREIWGSRSTGNLKALSTSSSPRNLPILATSGATSPISSAGKSNSTPSSPRKRVLTSSSPTSPRRPRTSPSSFAPLSPGLLEPLRPPAAGNSSMRPLSPLHTSIALGELKEDLEEEESSASSYGLSSTSYPPVLTQEQPHPGLARSRSYSHSSPGKMKLLGRSRSHSTLTPPSSPPLEAATALPASRSKHLSLRRERQQPSVESWTSDFSDAPSSSSASFVRHSKSSSSSLHKRQSVTHSAHAPLRQHRSTQSLAVGTSRPASRASSRHRHNAGTPSKGKLSPSLHALLKELVQERRWTCSCLLGLQFAQYPLLLRRSVHKRATLPGGIEGENLLHSSRSRSRSLDGTSTERRGRRSRSSQGGKQHRKRRREELERERETEEYWANVQSVLDLVRFVFEDGLGKIEGLLKEMLEEDVAGLGLGLGLGVSVDALRDEDNEQGLDLWGSAGASGRDDAFLPSHLRRGRLDPHPHRRLDQLGFANASASFLSSEAAGFAPASAPNAKLVEHLQRVDEMVRSAGESLRFLGTQLSSPTALSHTPEHTALNASPTQAEADIQVQEEHSRSSESHDEALERYEQLRKQLGIALREVERAKPVLVQLLDPHRHERSFSGETKRDSLESNPGLTSSSTTEESSVPPYDLAAVADSTLTLTHRPSSTVIGLDVEGPTPSEEDGSMLDDDDELLKRPEEVWSYDFAAQAAVGAFDRERSKLSREERIKLKRAEREQKQRAIEEGAVEGGNGVGGGEGATGPSTDVVQELKDVIWMIGERRRGSVAIEPGSALPSDDPTS